VETARGRQLVWTTFSDDQIDLNYANPRVLLEMTDVLLHYVGQGAELIRLDAIGYLWKETGTACIHLPQAHAVVKLWRAMLDSVAPGVMLITETNVPHAENISYFGQPLPGGSTDEAQLVYNFSLAPLVLHALQTGSTERLAQWAAGLEAPARGGTFFNFIASHDGIGVMPARSILSEGEVQGLVEQAVAHGGRVSYRNNPDGSQSVYELNITLYDFLNDPARPDEAVDIQRFMASQVILLSLAGVPGIYVHSLLGSSNCQACVAETGRARSINRQKHPMADLEADLADPATRARRVLDRYRHLLRQRQRQAAFHPAGEQRVLALHPQVFAVLRLPVGGGAGVLVLVNVSDCRQQVGVPRDRLPEDLARQPMWLDLVGGGRIAARGGWLPVQLRPYQAVWLTPL
jgi:sucrose phosphorylase